MKKWVTVLLALCLVLGLAACGNNNAQTPNQPAQGAQNAANDAQAPEQTPETAADEGGKVLVVYYSATGSTEAVAGYIAEAVDGDTFAITPTEPYTSDDLNWRNEESRVTKEHDDESLREVALETTTVEGWENYDTVFIGYPIWWGIAAWPVDGFVKANDFTGKTVIPFCTSSSSDLGQSGQLLADLAGNGDWQDGERFASSATKDDVLEWVNSLEILK